MNAQVKTANAERFIKIGADGKPVAADAESWVIVADGDSGLMWAVEPIKVSNWKPATIKKIEKKIADQKLGGFDDWRIPTVDELFALADRTVKNGPAIDAEYFPDTPEDWFWTSTPYARSSDCAWDVGFGSGSADWSDRGGNGFVRAVRGGQ